MQDDRIPISGTATSPVYQYYVDVASQSTCNIFIVNRHADLYSVYGIANRIVVVLNDFSATHPDDTCPTCYVYKENHWVKCSFAVSESIIASPSVQKLLTINKTQADPATSDAIVGFYKLVTAVSNNTIVFDGTPSIFEVTASQDLTLQYTSTVFIPTDVIATFLLKIVVTADMVRINFPIDWCNIAKTFNALLKGTYVFKVDLVDNDVYFRALTSTTSTDEYSVYCDDRGNILTDGTAILS